MSVYFLDCPAVNRIKIGTAVCAERRIEAVRLICPSETFLLGVIRGDLAEERALHERFADLRRHGEWFEGTDYLRRELWILTVRDLWNRAPDEWRERFIDYVQAPVFDRTSAGAA